jgi:hypothetical protein
VADQPDITDFDRVRNYCASHEDEFGGRFADGERIFGVLFTGHRADHELSLRALLSHPELLTVRSASRTWREVELANLRLQRLLLGTADDPAQRHPAVNGVGIAMADGQFKIAVIVDPERRDAVEEVVSLAQPEPVTIKFGSAMELR